MISVNSDRLRNPANKSGSKKNKKQMKPDNTEKKNKARLILALLLGLFIVWGGVQIGALQVISERLNDMWNQSTKMLGIRLEKIILIDYELVGEDGSVLTREASTLPKKEILETLGLENYQRGTHSLMAFDPDDMKERLEQLPWIQYVVVKRFLPDTIQIHIVPRTAFVMQKKGDEFVMLDSFGNELPMSLEADNNKLLHITGENSFKASMGLINIVAEEPELLEKIELAERISARRWNIYLHNGVMVKMPEEGELAAWKTLANLDKQQNIFDYAVNVIDFRVKGRLILRGDFKTDIPKAQKMKEGI